MNPEEQRCGLVAVVGAPNAGKSTFINFLLICYLPFGGRAIDQSFEENTDTFTMDLAKIRARELFAEHPGRQVSSVAVVPLTRMHPAPRRARSPTPTSPPSPNPPSPSNPSPNSTVTCMNQCTCQCDCHMNAH